MTYTLELQIPGLPKRTNNNSGNWRARHAEATKWKRLVINAVRWSGKQRTHPLPKAQLTLTRASSVCPDFDGLVSGFKHVLDGLIEAGVIENDKIKNIGVPTYNWTKAPRGKGHITVLVEEVA